MNLSQINVYPIKSCRGISLQESVVEERGLRHDRRWMIVDRQGRFVSQRTHPRLALVTVEILTEGLRVNAPKMESLSIPFQPEEKRTVRVQVWGDNVDAMAVGSKQSDWFGKFLGVPCHLVYMPDTTFRPVSRDYASKDERIGFADAFPFLLISEASLEELNTRLNVPIPMNRFRPNFVVAGCGPFAEDHWRTIQIGSVIFHPVKPCSRCVTTTVDQSTGIAGTEPLKTLATFREKKGKVLFGQNLLHENSRVRELPSVRVGDSITVIDEHHS